MIDRLAEIKSRAKPHLEIALDQPDISWLIAEVVALRAKVAEAERILARDWPSTVIVSALAALCSTGESE